MYQIEEDTPIKTARRVKLTFPKDFSGKFGFSFSFGKQEVFIGIAIAQVEIETVVRKRKGKVFKIPGKAQFVPS